MIISLINELEVYEQDINSGDVLILKDLDEDSDLGHLVSMLYIYDNSRFPEEAYLINLDSLAVYPSNDYMMAGETENDYEVVMHMLNELKYALIEIIPGDEIEIRRTEN